MRISTTFSQTIDDAITIVSVDKEILPSSNWNACFEFAKKEVNIDQYAWAIFGRTISICFLFLLRWCSVPFRKCTSTYENLHNFLDHIYYQMESSYITDFWPKTFFRHYLINMHKNGWQFTTMTIIHCIYVPFVRSLVLCCAVCSGEELLLALAMHTLIRHFKLIFSPLHSPRPFHIGKWLLFIRPTVICAFIFPCWNMTGAQLKKNSDHSLHNDFHQLHNEMAWNVCD